jgi:hypothetical protein
VSSWEGGPPDSMGNPTGGIPGSPMPGPMYRGGGLLPPDGDPLYGRRGRTFRDPFPAWNPAIADVLRQGRQAVGANTTVELVSYTPARGQVAYIQGFGQDATCDAFPEVTWRILIGQRVWLHFQPIAQVADFASLYPLHLPVLGGNKVSVSVTTGANQRTLAAMLVGVEKPVDTASPEKA